MKVTKYCAPPQDVVFINLHTLIYITSKSFEALVASYLGKDVLWCLPSMQASHTWCNVTSFKFMPSPFYPTLSDSPYLGGQIFGAKSRLLHSKTLPHSHFPSKHWCSENTYFFPFMFQPWWLYWHCSPHTTILVKLHFQALTKWVW